MATWFLSVYCWKNVKKKHKTIKDIHVYFMFVNPLRTHVKFIISLYVFHKLWPAVVAVVRADLTTKVNLNNIPKMEKLMLKLGNFNPEWVTESSMFLPSVKGGLFIHFSMTWFLSSKNIICAVILMFEFAQREMEGAEASESCWTEKRRKTQVKCGSLAPKWWSCKGSVHSRGSCVIQVQQTAWSKIFNFSKFWWNWIVKQAK